ncbi:helix-turn-helix transcriptional regulator [Actinokineospora sp. NBRC 105648]|uniref:helix-turn-helix domain-containing protein n=1 Tax=Actinokineospora sp. NBRC 105648 TaxID=3032206 RepID=UPI0024A5DD74|nr:helix-turn-helix transcriptional regulator [Actinokineospora sp. NBRC 105648]GLZ42429.1 transcriptional regulator [Actinokineospora sp. NBRC 105648]
MPLQGPLIPRRRLGAELRRLRMAAGLALEDAAAHLECSTSKVSRLETGQGVPKARDVRDLLGLYQVDDQKVRDRLVRLAGEGRRQGWWQDFSSVVTPNVDIYMSLEAEASKLRGFVSSTVPGLLQTEDYARELFQAIYPRPKAGENENRVRMRMRRQDMVTEREEPLHLNFVIDEAVLHRRVGSAAVMRDQLAALIEASRLPHVQLRVFPFRAGPDIAGQCTFVVFTFESENDRNAVNIEASLDDRWLEQEAEVSRYTTIFTDLVRKCPDPDGSRAVIEDMLKKYSDER